MSEQIICNCSALRRAARRVSLMYDRELTSSGLTSGQFGILVEISGFGKSAPTIGALAEALVMDRAGLTHTLKPLERDGLVTLRSDPSDARARLVNLTAEGRKRLAKASVGWARAQQNFTRSFGERQATALRSLLQLVSQTELSDVEA
jgi:DNA-binding MarR family transcriptional regulator